MGDQGGEPRKRGADARFELDMSDAIATAIEAAAAHESVQAAAAAVGAEIVPVAEGRRIVTVAPPLEEEPPVADVAADFEARTAAARALRYGPEGRPEMTREQVQDARFRMLGTELFITDPQTGLTIEADMSNPVHRHMVAEQKGVDVMVQVGGRDECADPRLSSVSFPPDRFPEEMKTAGIFPLEVLPVVLQQENNELRAMMMWTPLLPTGVYAANLWLAATGERSPIVMDSFQILRDYRAIIYTLLAQPQFVRSLHAARLWMAASTTATPAEFAVFFAHAEVEDSTPTERALFETGVATPESRASVAARLVQVRGVPFGGAKYGGEPWRGAGVVFVEDVLADLNRQGKASVADIARRLPQGTTDRDAIHAVNLETTWDMLNQYETAIQRILNETYFVEPPRGSTEPVGPALAQPTADFCTRRIEPDGRIINPITANSVRMSLDVMTRLRAKVIMGREDIEFDATTLSADAAEAAAREARAAATGSVLDGDVSQEVVTAGGRALNATAAATATAPTEDVRPTPEQAAYFVEFLHCLTDDPDAIDQRETRALAEAAALLPGATAPPSFLGAAAGPIF